MTGEILRPCPFCGGEAHMVPDEACVTQRARWYTIRICCEGCSAELVGGGSTTELAETSATNLWNHRAERTCRDVMEPPKGGGFWPSPTFRCSECGETHVSTRYVEFCPHCGARVEDGEGTCPEKGGEA